jgi:hypothetical protein
MSNSRTWIFRALVLAAAAFFVFSWFQPWWTAYVVELKVTAINIYAYGLESFIPAEYKTWIAGYDEAMPAWFTPFMWVYLVICMAVLAFSLFAKSEKGISLGKFRISLPTLLIAGVGLSVIGVCIIGIIVIQMNLVNFYNAPLNGTIIVDMGDPYSSEVDTSLLSGYYMMWATGAVLLVLSILRQFIVGKSK